MGVPGVFLVILSLVFLTSCGKKTENKVSDKDAIEDAKRKYKRGKITIDTLQEIYKSLQLAMNPLNSYTSLTKDELNQIDL